MRRHPQSRGPSAPSAGDAPVQLTYDNDAQWARIVREGLRDARGGPLFLGPVPKWFTHARLERFFRGLHQLDGRSLGDDIPKGSDQP